MSKRGWEKCEEFHQEIELWRVRAEIAEKREEDTQRRIEQLRKELECAQETCDLWKADAEAAKRARDRAEALLEGMTLVEKQRRMREITMRVWVDKEPEDTPT